MGKITNTLYNLSSKNAIKQGVYSISVILFLLVVLLPPLLGIVIKWNTIGQVFAQPEIMSRALNATANSFLIALSVAALDLVAGIPLAWLVSRGKSRWLSVIDTLADIPFIVPTAALGYSLFLFWNSPEGISTLFGYSLVSPGWLLVAILHFTFSYPVVVRVIVGALLDYKLEFERAARTLGAPPLTAARTVTFSIIKPSLIAAFILAFARSVSETGATMLVAGTFENGPTFIQHIKNDFSTTNPALYEGSIVFASFTLIIVSCLIFAIIHILGPRLKWPMKRIWPKTDRKLSYTKAAFTRNSMTLLIFLAIVLIPSLFVALPAFEAIFTDTLPKAISAVHPWEGFWQSLALSYLLGAIVTVMNVAIGLPMAIIIARKKLGKFTSAVLDLLVNVPLIVPSIALGVSLKFFWKETLAFIPEIWLLIFAHLAITYPYFVKSTAAAIERIGVDMEEAAKTLGAKPLVVFRTIVLPLTKYSILSGAIMTFTRSVSETGATLAVVTTLKTAPVVLVEWVKPKPPQLPATPLEIGLGCGFLIIFSFVILLTLRLIIRKRGGQ